MNDKNERLQSEQIDAELRLLDQFAHPQISESTQSRLKDAVAVELAHQRRRRMIFRVATPLAAAAGIILAAAVVFNLVSTTNPTPNGPIEVATADNGQLNELDWRIDLLLADFEAVGLVATGATTTNSSATDEAGTSTGRLELIEQQIQELAEEFTT